MATERQKKALELIVESHGKKAVSKAMVEAGYSPISAKNPINLTKSQYFQEVMERAGVDDVKLVSVLKEGLEANKVIVMGKDSAESFVDIQPDHPTRHKFLETSLKIKGIGKDVEPAGGTFIQINNDMSNRYV